MLRELFAAMYSEEDGVLSFEWTLLLTLLTLGIVGGLAATRDAVIDELSDLAEAVLNFDQSYSLADFDIPGVFENNPSVYTDDGYIHSDCARLGVAAEQLNEEDTDS
jgi:Flp pilus assembly pilin Flp